MIRPGVCLGDKGNQLAWWIRCGVKRIEDDACILGSRSWVVSSAGDFQGVSSSMCQLDTQVEMPSGQEAIYKAEAERGGLSCGYGLRKHPPIESAGSQGPEEVTWGE